MSNGSEACCILGICCPPASAERVTALVKVITDNTDINGKASVEEIAQCVLDQFDLAPKGTLQPLLAQVAHLARKHADSGA